MQGIICELRVVCCKVAKSFIRSENCRCRNARHNLTSDNVRCKCATPFIEVKIETAIMQEEISV